MMPMYVCNPEEDPRVVAVIGAGAAAAAAVEALRQQCFIGRIVMISLRIAGPTTAPT